MNHSLKTASLQIVTLFVVLVLGACANSGSDANPDENGSTSAELELDSLSQFARVIAEGSSILMGTNDQDARTMERPQMKVTFSYDFSIGRSEILCSDFNRLMKDASGLVAECPSDSIPVSNVTFFDAVLYANALSKSKGLDSCYTYSSASFDSDYHCVLLDDFSFRPESKGFRLPTEAEWMLVAAKNWNPDESWNGKNSEGTVHKVCSFEHSDSLICDMAGNLLEWVNDWQGSFMDTTIQNFVGAPDGGVLGTCVVKGGSYMTSPDDMELFHRGDTYPVLKNSMASYVGFRLAYGAIPKAQWLSGQAAKSQVSSLMEASQVFSITGSRGAKVAFRNDETQNLAYINYGAMSPSIVEIQDTFNVFHPEISPDGHYVAFCTVMEGVSGKSALYVRELNAFGSGLVKLDVESAAIPRWRVDENGDTLIVYVTSAANNRNASFMDESTWQVPFAKGKFGTPEKLFDGAYHGGLSLDGKLAVTGSQRLLAHHVQEDGSASDTLWYDDEQACNASLAKDSSKRTLFLDFGGNPGREFSKESYGVHERMIIVDSVGQIVQMVPVAGDYSFDHTEWATLTDESDGNDLAIASLTNWNGAHSQIALVDVSDSNVVPLVEGGELWHPSLWLKNKDPLSHSGLNLDSAGVYFQKSDGNPFIFSSVELGMKLQSFWKVHEDVEVVALGSSMLLDAVIDDSIKSYKALNMGVTLADVHLMEFLVKNYVLPYAPHLKVLVVEVVPGFLYRKSTDYFQYLYVYSPGLNYDAHHLSSETVDGVSRNSLEQEYPMDLFSQQYMEGSMLLPSVSWSVPSVESDHFLPYESELIPPCMEKYESIVNAADSNGVKVVFAITPRNPEYRNTKAFSLYGPDRDVAKKLIADLAKLNVTLFDENKDGLHDYPDEMAYNCTHLSYLGAAQFTRRLDSLLNVLK